MIVGLVCPCIEPAEDKTVREAIEMLQQGKTFKQSKKDSGAKDAILSMFGAGGNKEESSDLIKIYLSGTELVHEFQTLDDNQLGSEDKKIWLQKIGEVKAKSSKRICIIGNHPMRPGEVLSDVEITTTEEDRDDFVDALNICLEEYRKNPSDVETVSSADDDVTGIKGRAKRAAHFAKKEIEMKQRKQEREKMKAKYMKGSKGLKYTAIAMANRA